MNMADRIQYLRKTKGISQEELADKVGVSRQAVSKWESEQSVPDLDKVITMSEYFDVTTDYILRGIEPTANKDVKSSELTSKILYLASTAFIAIGLFCAFGGWYEKQTADSIWGSMSIRFLLSIISIHNMSINLFILRLIDIDNDLKYVLNIL